MGRWLEMHRWRSIVVNLPAAVCFVVAAVEVMEVMDVVVYVNEGSSVEGKD
jgi:hypothetical protein